MAAHDRTRLTGPPRTHSFLSSNPAPRAATAPRTARRAPCARICKVLGFSPARASESADSQGFSHVLGQRIYVLARRTWFCIKDAAQNIEKRGEPATSRSLSPLAHQSCCPKPAETVRQDRRGSKRAAHGGRGCGQGTAVGCFSPSPATRAMRKRPRAERGPGPRRRERPAPSRGRRTRRRSPRASAWGSARPRRPARRRARRHAWCPRSRWARSQSWTARGTRPRRRP